MKEKIIFINFWSKGGMHHYSDALVNILSEEYEIYYFSNYKSEINCKNIIYKISINPINPINYIVLFIIIYNIIKLKPKVIHLNSGYPTLFPIYPLFYFYNSIATVHDAVLHEGEKRLKIIFHKIQLLLFSIFFKKILVHSEKIKEELPLHINRKKIFILPHVNYNHLAKNTVNNKKINNKFTILFFGRILKYKGLQYLIEAFKKLDEDKYELIIAGEGLIDFFIAQKNIKIINKFIEDEEIPSLFINSDIVVLPYESASQSGVIYLSLAFNKPVIVSDVGSFAEVIKNNVNGIIIKSKSVFELLEAIKCISNNDYYKKLVYNIKCNNEENLNNVQVTLKNIYESI